MMQIIEQTPEEKLKMYMRCKKVELAKMLIECNRIIRNRTPDVTFARQLQPKGRLPHFAHFCGKEEISPKDLKKAKKFARDFLKKERNGS